MPVKGRNIESRKQEYMPEFSREKDYFAIGEMFWYKPKNFKDSESILVMPVKDRDPKKIALSCAKNCAMYQFCSSSDNWDAGFLFVPKCFASNREDGNNVYFELCR